MNEYIKIIYILIFIATVIVLIRTYIKKQEDIIKFIKDFKDIIRSENNPKNNKKKRR